MIISSLVGRINPSSSKLDFYIIESTDDSLTCGSTDDSLTCGYILTQVYPYENSELYWRRLEAELIDCYVILNATVNKQLFILYAMLS